MSTKVEAPRAIVETPLGRLYITMSSAQHISAESVPYARIGGPRLEPLPVTINGVPCHIDVSVRLDGSSAYTSWSNYSKRAEYTSYAAPDVTENAARKIRDSLEGFLRQYPAENPEVVQQAEKHHAANQLQHLDREAGNLEKQLVEINEQREAFRAILAK